MGDNPSSALLKMAQPQETTSSQGRNRDAVGTKLPHPGFGAVCRDKQHGLTTGLQFHVLQRLAASEE